MKALFYGFALAIFLYSCGDTSKDRIHEQKEDQKLLAEQQVRSDSLKKVRIDSLAQIAWGETKFGMSLNEVEKTEVFKIASNFGSKNNPFQSLTLFSSETKVEGISRIDAQFFNDRLFRIVLETNERTANYYDTEIKETVLSLKTLIENKYGNATRSNGFPSFLEMKPDKLINAYRWDIGDKNIYIDVKEVYSGSKYNVECRIFHDKEIEPVREFHRKIREEKESKQVNGF